MNDALAYGFAALTIAAIIMAAIYTGLRLGRLFGMRRRWPLPVAIGLVVAGALVFTGAAVRSTSAVVGGLYVAFGYGFYLVINLCLALALAHLASRLLKAPRKIADTVAVIVAAGITVAGALSADRLAVVETPIRMVGLNREVRIAQISDLHLGHHRGRDALQRVVAAVNRARPDIVVMTGDIVDSDVALEPGVLAPLRQLKAPAYYVIGNHEKEIDTDLALRRIADAGVRVLHNEVVDAGPLQLVGLDYMNADDQAFNMHPSHEGTTIRSTLERLKLRPNVPTVMLHHAPTGVEYADRAGVGLVLAGHTHGGQFFPFNLATPILFPFDRGLYRDGSLQVFVSPGVGTFMVRARLGVPGQINILRLDPSR